MSSWASQGHAQLKVAIEGARRCVGVCFRLVAGVAGLIRACGCSMLVTRKARAASTTNNMPIVDAALSDRGYGSLLKCQVVVPSPAQMITTPSSVRTSRPLCLGVDLGEGRCTVPLRGQASCKSPAHLELPCPPPCVVSRALWWLKQLRILAPPALN